MSKEKTGSDDESKSESVLEMEQYNRERAFNFAPESPFLPEKQSAGAAREDTESKDVRDVSTGKPEFYLPTQYSSSSDESDGDKKPAAREEPVEEAVLQDTDEEARPGQRRTRV